MKTSHPSTRRGQGVPAGADIVERWFRAQGWTVFPFQREAWAAYARGESGLIHSPTGSGKTLAAWFGPVLDHGAGDGAVPPVTVVWVTPLRALAVDTFRTLQRSVDDLDIGWTVGLRTGDTTSTERKRQTERLPTALVTTPESLSLLLSYRETARQLGQVRAVIADEWHELLGSKRGVQLQLCLAHLRAKQPALRVWGLSATLGNIDEAAGTLLGPSARPTLIRGGVPKVIRISGLLPENISSFPWAGYSSLKMLPQVVAALEPAGTSLLFTNTRSQAERWFEALVKARPDWVGSLALHHGSLELGLRREVEDLLRRGQLKCVVATSSLDLGVDFSPVERVLQVGSPKGVARLLQRAGRSGHRPGAISEVLCVPTQALELAEIAAARAAAAEERIEARRPPRLSLDLLCQHLVTLALAGGIAPDTVLTEARSTHAFADLSNDAWQWVIDFVTRGGPALHAYPQFRRLEWRDGRLHPANPRVARQHRMAIGTISSDASLRVQYQRGAFLGTIEESFISRLKPGDTFLFAGRKLEMLRVRDMVVQVRLATGKKPAVPRWWGGRMPLSTALADAMLEQFAAFRDGQPRPPEIERLAPLLELQAHRSHIPVAGEFLVERCRTREGCSLFMYPFAGRLVHEGLSALLAWRAGRLRPTTISCSINDYGFELLSQDELPADPEILETLLATDDLAADILEAINAGEMAKRQFRDIARVAGLVFQGYPGARKTVRQVQASSGLIYDVLARYDPDNRLLSQSQQEVLDTQFELARLRETMERIARCEWIQKDTDGLSPLAFPLRAERSRARLSSESWRERIEKLQQRLTRSLDER